MARVKYDLLNIRFQKRYKNKGFMMKENTGLDTETLEGYAKLICDSEGNYKMIESFDDILYFLTRTHFRNKYNWFYNIQFDFESIIKYLDYAQLLELYAERKIQYDENYSIEYIPKKYFAIKSKSNMNYYFYDLYNFLDTSLNKASKKFLHDEKLDIVDAKQLNISAKYWKGNEKNIIKYCLKDALLTKNLADYFWGIIYEKLNFYPKTPMSKGKLSEEYFLHTCNIPVINRISDKVVACAYESFYGGHFEILKRGYFDKVITYDIHSAYPFQIAKQIDYSKGTWEKVDKLNPDCHTGFYKCLINCLETNFSPFKQKIGGSAGLNIYPNGTFKQFLTKEEIEFYGARFENSDIKIEFGYEFTPKEIIYPFKTEIERLYAWKEKETDADIKYCVKILLNSLYGKFIQVSGDYNQTGKLFNPIYASKITAGTRIKILDLALQDPENIISFSTDSVTSMKKLKIPKDSGLGDFGLDFEGEGVLVMSDVYNMWNYDTKKVKTKLRGFTLATSRDIDAKEVYLKDILAGMTNNTVYEYFTERPYHLGECITHRLKRSISDLNKFGKVKKSIDVNGDSKRIWDKSFKNGKECLEEYHSSLPIMIGA
jgi:hypothetical protein